MIITKAKSYKEIVKELRKSDKIGVISCNACVRACGTGGENILKRFSSKLKKDGYNVVDVDLIGIPCDRSQLQKNQLHGDTQIVLACDAGVYNLKKLFPKNKIIGALETVGLGAKDSRGKPILVKKF